MRRSHHGRKVLAATHPAPAASCARRVRFVDSGMSLVEVLVVTSLLAIVVGALMPVLTVSEQTWRYAHRRTEMVENARIGLDHMIDKLRAVQSFSAVGATSIAYTYFYGDNSTVFTAEHRLNGNELEWRNDPTSAFAPLAGPFRSMSVSCFDRTGATIACNVSVASARAVEVSLVVMDPTGEVPDITVTARAFRQAP